MRGTPFARIFVFPTLLSFALLADAPIVEAGYGDEEEVPPDAPSGLTATAISADEVYLEWTDPSASAEGFTVQRKTDGGSFGTIADAGSSDYTDSGLAADTAYTYRVSAYNGEGNSSFSSEAQATTLGDGAGDPGPEGATSPVVLTPSKDTTIYQENSSRSNGSGSQLYIGRTCGTGGTTNRRALIAFDVSGIPSNATIDSVSLQINYDRRSSQNSSSHSFSLHKVLSNWDEAGSIGGGSGAAAQTNDATWSHRLFNVSTWNSSGGDFTESASDTATFGGNSFGPKIWSSSQMAADVQSWLENPSSNFGWLVKGAESTSCSAKRFDSSEGSASTRPKLTIAFTPGKQDQFITFPSISTKTFNDPNFPLNATTNAQGLSVTYQVTAGSQFVSLNGGTVTIQGAGAVTIEATQTGNDDFNPAAPVSRSFTINKDGQTISFNNPGDKMLSASPVTLVATATSGLTVTFSVTNGPAAVNGTSLTLNAAGSVTVRAAQSGNSNYNPAPNVDQTFTVTAPSNRQSWLDDQFGNDQNNPAIAGDDVVNSSDGLSNLLKYAFDLDPFEAHPEARPAPGLGIFTIDTVDCEFLTIQFTRMPAADDLTYEVRVGDDLSGWTTIYSSIQGADPATNPDLFTETGDDRRTVTVRDTVKTDSVDGANRFIQLVVTREIDP